MPKCPLRIKRFKIPTITNGKGITTEGYEINEFRDCIDEECAWWFICDTGHSTIAGCAITALADLIRRKNDLG